MNFKKIFKIFKPQDFDFKVGQIIHSKENGSVFSIKREMRLNRIKHFEICMENDPSKREIILSEYALKVNYNLG